MSHFVSKLKFVQEINGQDDIAILEKEIDILPLQVFFL
jgi:hypothetical protein